MAHISVIYAIIGEDPEDGIWAFKLSAPNFISGTPVPIGAELIASDAPDPRYGKEKALKRRVENIKKMADRIASLTGKKYKVCRFVFEREL